ncbi:STAS domain-containing protein [Sphingomonas sp. LaA6.9]|uniref:STAS domain-containing protein n=1 Tax=Sphingomonas sp. LaA6.9 TaxID=2919914 RepID=UPI001F4F8FFF|nr:STAS domain-containing protein [Sphingomonas sp. LaA6.9]MCJ8158685.1 STAS domain-containing protein [Sphingomonas sp. LaA6.9]
MQHPSDMPGDDRSLRLPVHGSTTTAEDLRVRLVLASDLDGEMVVDASEVESVGQAVLQLLIAAKAEADSAGQSFVIANPSPAFVARVAACRLGDAIGLATEEETVQ